MFYEVAHDVFEVMLGSMHQHLPAKVVRYDAATRKATVQPLIKYRDRSAGVDNKGLVDMPVIQGVSVMMLGTDESLINVPVKVGSKVMLCFSSKAGDTFKLSNNEQTVDPDDDRIFDVNDCYCIPVAPMAFSRAVGSDSSDLRLIMNLGTSNECSVSLKPSGEVRVVSPLKVTTEAPLVQVITEVAEITASDHVTIDSPQTTHTGNLRVDGEISSGGDVHTDAGISLENSKMIGNLGRLTSKMLPA